MKTYRVSALASAFVRMWRGWAVIVPVVIVNAILQALLIGPDPTPGDGLVPILLALASAVVFIVAYGLAAAAVLHVADGRVGWVQAARTLKANGGGYVLSVVGLTIVIAIGLALYGLPGLLVLAVTPFLLLAALDGQPNVLAANFRTIAPAPGAGWSPLWSPACSSSSARSSTDSRPSSSAGRWPAWSSGSSAVSSLPGSPPPGH